MATMMSEWRVLGTAPYIEEVRQKMVVWGQAPDPLRAGSSNADSRRWTCASLARTRTLAASPAWCAARKEVRRVHYPRTEDHPDHEVARTFLDGFGGMLDSSSSGAVERRALRPAPAPDQARPQPRGVDSLVSEPRFSSHTHLSSDERAALGIPDGFLR
jgi:hypothetical protein